MMERFRTEKVQAVFHGRSHVEIQQNEKQTLMSESSPGSEGTSPALRTALSEAEDKLIEILGIISLFNSRATSTGD
jgi:hypothetical protein